jgi:hypothetical protein
MTRKGWMTAAASAFALALTVGGAQSGPLGSAASDLRSAVPAGSGFERIAYRLCWTEGGARQCRWVDNARIYRDSRVSGYVSPRVGYRSPAMSHYAARRVYGYSSARVSRYGPPRLYRTVPVYGYAAPSAFAYQPSAIYVVRPPIVRYYRRVREWDNPDVYRTGSASWWAVMDLQDRGGQTGN